MTVSTLRTLVWVPNSGRMLPIRYAWPVKNAAEVLDYGFDLSALIADVGDAIVAASAANAPSGDGELQISNLAVAGNVLTFRATGGVAGRLYTIDLSAATEAGRIFAELPTLFIDKTLAVYPLPAPPSAGFCTPIVWPAEGIGFALTVGGQTIAIGGSVLTIGATPAPGEPLSVGGSVLAI